MHDLPTAPRRAAVVAFISLLMPLHAATTGAAVAHAGINYTRLILYSVLPHVECTRIQSLYHFECMVKLSS
jgi:hypothetical protein